MAVKRRRGSASTTSSADLCPCQRLLLFLTQADELSQRRLVRSGIAFDVHLVIDAHGHVIATGITQPDEEDFRSFLLDFRHFIASGEPVFYLRVLNDAWRLVDDGSVDRADAIRNLRTLLQIARSTWQEINTYVPAHPPGSSEVAVSGQRLLDLWINGYYFHNDPAHAQTIARLVADHQIATRGGLFRAVQALTFNILQVAEGLRQALAAGLLRCEQHVDEPHGE